MSKENNTTENKPIPAFLRADYPYKTVGEVIQNVESIADKDAVYEIKCNICEMSIRSKGNNIKNLYNRLKTSGCLGCGNTDLVVKLVDI